jgi:hypothetical protein
MSEKEGRRVEDETQAEYRSAAVNAALALSAFKVAEPYAKDAYKKLKDKKK